MKQSQGWLKGKKTYMVGGGLVALGIAICAGWAQLSPEQMAGAVSLLMGVGQMFLRAGVAEVQEKVEG